MNHAVVTEHLADYLEGDLALDLRALVDAHLDTCPDCALEVREMQQTIRILRALPEPETPPMIAANVMRRIRAGETRPSFYERIARVLGGVLEPSFVLPTSAMAVAALVIFAIQGGGPLTGSLGATGAADDEGPVALRASSPAVPSQPEESELDFGASAARELAAAPAPSRRTSAAVPSPDREGSPSSTTSRHEGPGPDSVYAARDPMVVAPRESQQSRQGHGRSQGFGGPGPGDSMLAQGFASEVSGPATPSASNRVSGAFGSAMPTSLSRPISGAPQGLQIEGTGGEDPRDAWLARALENPVEFAQYIARHNLAEQELWVERLSERALSRGLLTELVEALRAAGNEKASWLADDFAAQGEAEDSTSADGQAVHASEDSPALDR